MLTAIPVISMHNNNIDTVHPVHQIHILIARYFLLGILHDCNLKIPSLDGPL